MAFDSQIFEDSHPVEFIDAFFVLYLDEIHAFSEDKDLSKFHMQSFIFLCEFAKGLIIFQSLNLDIMKKKRFVLNKIHSYFLSLGNREPLFIRAALLHYFSYVHREKYLNGLDFFMKLFYRFGYTVLNQILEKLFQSKKHDALMMSYILENLPHFLMKGTEIEGVIALTLKHYFLRYPEKFLVFVKTMNEEFLKYDESFQDLWLHQVVGYFQVIARYGHYQWSKEMLTLIYQFKAVSSFDDSINKLSKDFLIKKRIRLLVKENYMNFVKNKKLIFFNKRGLHKTKRGRKPSLANHLLSFKEQIESLYSLF
jgi:hypothetical protein